MSDKKEKDFEPKSLAQAARTSPTAVFDAPDDVVQSGHLTKKEKVEVLDQWEADAKALETATDEGMSGGKRPRLDDVKAAQTELDAKALGAGGSAVLEKPTAPIIVTANSARGALGPDETTLGDTLLPMLIGGLVLAVLGLIVAMLLV
jgi:hypothetical protein